MRGRLIVFEGVEGCGKTTQLQRSLHWLESLVIDYASVPFSAIATREPGGTELGLALRSLLLDNSADQPIQDSAELLLYAADRAQHVEQVLKPQLTKATIILCDRYTDSTIAYQGYGRGLSLDLISQLNFIATGGLEGDLTLWLDVDVEVSLARKLSRGTADRIEQADLAFHQRVQQGYIKLAQSYPERIVRVDASLSVAAVQEQIQTILLERLSKWYHN